MSANASPSRPSTTGQTNPPRELARYRVSSGELIIVGQRVRGVVRLTDVPATWHGRRYLIERELTAMAELEAIVADYLAQAQRWNAVPVEPRWLARPDTRRQR
jgi:hypothetical protein